MAWQVTYPPEFHVNIGEQPPRVRFAPNFNGVSQYAQLPSEQVFSGDFSLKMTMQRSATTAAIFGGTGNSRCYEQAAGGFELADSSTLFIPNVFTDITVGETFEIEISRVASLVSVYINNSIRGSGNYSSPVKLLHLGRPQFIANLRSGNIYNYSDSLGNNFPMDDGWQNNPTMRNTGSGAGGAFINMTEAAWQEIPL